MGRGEWNDCLNRYLNDMPLTSWEHELMNEKQKWMIHELDKAKQRLEVKE